MAEQKIVTLSKEQLDLYGAEVFLRVEVGPNYYRTVHVTPTDYKHLPDITKRAAESIVKQIEYEVSK